MVHCKRYRGPLLPHQPASYYTLNSGQVKESCSYKNAGVVEKKNWERLLSAGDGQRLLAPLLGGHPDECPAAYALSSPGTHVHPGCPPTLLIQGGDDIMSPAATTRILHSRLLIKKVPAVINILLQTDYAFDLVLPKISPPATTYIIMWNDSWH